MSRIVVTLPDDQHSKLKATLALEKSNISKWVREEAEKKIAQQKSLATALR